MQLFSKTESVSCLNWVFRKAAFGNCGEFNVHVTDAILNKVYMGEYLDSFYYLDEAITTVHDVTPFLTFGCFVLATFISSNCYMNVCRQRLLI